jgi:hypothetical protein
VTSQVNTYQKQPTWVGALLHKHLGKNDPKLFLQKFWRYFLAKNTQKKQKKYLNHTQKESTSNTTILTFKKVS